jgi:hypothetical protein
VDATEDAFVVFAPMGEGAESLMVPDQDHALSGTQPQQGSVVPEVDRTLSGTQAQHGDLSLKAKRQGQARPFVEEKRGDDLFRKTGRWSRRLQRIDHENDWYDKLVVDPETGEVIREVHEPLSEHQGYGSAKPKPEEAP